MGWDASEKQKEGQNPLSGLGPDGGLCIHIRLHRTHCNGTYTFIRTPLLPANMANGAVCIYLGQCDQYIGLHVDEQSCLMLYTIHRYILYSSAILDWVCTVKVRYGYVF